MTNNKKPTPFRREKTEDEATESSGEKKPTESDDRPEIEDAAQSSPTSESAATTASESETATTSRWGRKRTALLSVFGVLIVGLAVSTGVLYEQNTAAASTQDARTQALEAAKERVPKVLSYNYRRLDPDLDTAKKLVTGQFGTEYRALLDQAVRPSAVEQKIETKTSVPAASVIRGNSDSVDLLVFVNQITKSAKNQTPRIDGSRVTVTMSRAENGWLVSNLKPV